MCIIREVIYVYMYKKCKQNWKFETEKKEIEEDQGNQEKVRKFKYSEKLKFLALKKFNIRLGSLWNTNNLTIKYANDVSNINSNLHCYIKLIFQ